MFWPRYFTTLLLEDGPFRKSSIIHHGNSLRDYIIKLFYDSPATPNIHHLLSNFLIDFNKRMMIEESMTEKTFALTFVKHI